MADEEGEVEKRARSVPLPTEDDGERVIAQQNAGPDPEAGGGEWPSPQAPATGPAPGTTPEGSQAASRRAQAPSTSFSDVLDADPVAGGSSSAPADDDPVETSPS